MGKSGVRPMGEMGVWVEKYNTLSYETKITEKGLSFSFFFFSVFGERRRRQSPRAGGSLPGGSLSGGSVSIGAFFSTSGGGVESGWGSVG